MRWHFKRPRTSRSSQTYIIWFEAVRSILGVVMCEIEAFWNIHTEEIRQWN